MVLYVYGNELISLRKSLFKLYDETNIAEDKQNRRSLTGYANYTSVHNTGNIDALYYTYKLQYS